MRACVRVRTHVRTRVRTRVRTCVRVRVRVRTRVRTRVRVRACARVCVRACHTWMIGGEAYTLMLSLSDPAFSSKESDVEHRLPTLPLLPPLLPDAGRTGTVRPSTLAVRGLLLAVGGPSFPATAPRPWLAACSSASAYSSTSVLATFSALVFPFSAKLLTKKRISRFKLSRIMGGSAKKAGFGGSLLCT